MLSSIINFTAPISLISFFFFFNDTATTEIYTLSLHDALPISPVAPVGPAVADFYETGEDAVLTVAAAGVLGNDRGTGLHVTASATVSAWGSAVQVNADGSFTYTPAVRLQGLAAGESIVDRFTY